MPWTTLRPTEKISTSRLRTPSQIDPQNVQRALATPAAPRCLAKPEMVNLASEVLEDDRNKTQNPPRTTLSLAEGVARAKSSKRVVRAAKGLLQGDLGRARGWMQGLAGKAVPEVAQSPTTLVYLRGSVAQINLRPSARVRLRASGCCSLPCASLRVIPAKLTRTFRHHHLSIPPRPRMATSLSEKAKGKQRAADPPNMGESSPSIQPASRNLTIRFTEGGSDLIVHVDEKDTVKDVKQKVFGTLDTFSES